MSPTYEELTIAKGSSKMNNEIPAFPCASKRYEAVSLRDYFAAKASDADVLAQAEVIRSTMLDQTGVGILPDNWRSTARYMHADAMLKEREK